MSCELLGSSYLPFGFLLLLMLKDPLTCYCRARAANAIFYSFVAVMITMDKPME